MKKNIFTYFFFSLLCFSCSASSTTALKIVKNGKIENYDDKKIEVAVKESLISPKYEYFQKDEQEYVSITGKINIQRLATVYSKSPIIMLMAASSDSDLKTDNLVDNIADGLSDLGEHNFSYVFGVDKTENSFALSSLIIDDEEISTETMEGAILGNTMIGVLFGDENTFLIILELLSKNNIQQTAIPASEEYVSAQREIFDWYTSLGIIQTETIDEEPAIVRVDVALAYKQGDQVAEEEIENNKVVISAFLRNFLNSKTAAELRNPNNEDSLTNEILNGLNEKVFINARIRDVVFQQKDIIE